jgi:hypothetical protein
MLKSMRALRVRSAALSVMVTARVRRVFSRRDVHSRMHFTDALSRKVVASIIGEAVKAKAVEERTKGHWAVVSERRLSGITLAVYHSA